MVNEILNIKKHQPEKYEWSQKSGGVYKCHVVCSGYFLKTKNAYRHTVLASCISLFFSFSFLVKYITHFNCISESVMDQVQDPLQIRRYILQLLCISLLMLFAVLLYSSKGSPRRHELYALFACACPM